MQKEASLPMGELLRQAMRHWVTGVAVVTSRVGDASHGMTVNSFVSISLDPPLVTVTMNKNTRTLDFVQQAGTFGITVLSHLQQSVAEVFAGRHPDSGDRMQNVDTFTLMTGAPLITGGVSFLDCRLVYQYEMLNSILLIGEVLAARTVVDAPPPLIYINRTFRSLPEA